MHDSDHSDHNHHDHHHGHEHHHDHTSGDMPLEQKAVKLLEHWIRHNDDHGQNYLQWAEQLRKNGYLKAADALDEVLKLTVRISGLFRQAKDDLNVSGK